MEGRTVILVSHHVQLCASGAAYIVALDNGQVLFSGGRDEFQSSGIIKKLGQSSTSDDKDDSEEKAKLVEIENEVLGGHNDESAGAQSESSSTIGGSSVVVPKEKKPARKLVEEETRAVGRIKKEIWKTYILACGKHWYWTLFAIIFTIASLAPVLENNWLRCAFTTTCTSVEPNHHPGTGLLLLLRQRAARLPCSTSPYTQSSLVLGSSSRLCDGSSSTMVPFVLLLFSMNDFWKLSSSRTSASTTLCPEGGFSIVSERTLRVCGCNHLGVLSADQFLGIDSSLSDNFGRTIICALSALTTIITVSYVGGLPFIIIIIGLGYLYYSGEY